MGRLVLIKCEYDCLEGDGTQIVGRLPANHPHLLRYNTSDEDGQSVTKNLEPRPHICADRSPSSDRKDGNSTRECHVYTRNTNSVTINETSIKQATNPNADRPEWCHYPLAGEFSCHLPSPLGNSCRVLCDIEEPYTAQGSLLAQSQCQKLDGNPEVTFWTYLVVRCFGDCVLTAALVLVDTALIMATRDGAADLGRQLLAGVLGAAVFAPVSGYLSPYPAPGPTPAGWPVYGVPVIMFSGCMLVAAFVLLVCGGMPLGAPDWWWQVSRPTWGVPRRASYETAALFVVLAILGAFCSAIDSYLPWHLSFLRNAVDPDEIGLKGVTPDLLVGLTVLAGVLPAVPLLWRAEKLVHYCGYSNLLITAFTFYIIRFTGLSCVTSPWWTLVLEATEVFTLSVMWVTTILYFRHLLPRTFIATGQAIAVAAHFCIGRSLGALVGGLLAQDKPVSEEEPADLDGADADAPERAAAVDGESAVLLQLRSLYATGAVAAAVLAVFYFVVYHCCVRTLCGRKYTGNKSKSYGRAGVVSGANSNGAYTPLRSTQNGNGSRVERY